jgi:hypothetical protein
VNPDDLSLLLLSSRRSEFVTDQNAAFDAP